MGFTQLRLRLRNEEDAIAICHDHKGLLVISIFFREFLGPVLGLLLLAIIFLFTIDFVGLRAGGERRGVVQVPEEMLKQRVFSEVPAKSLSNERRGFAGRYFGSPFEPSSLEQLATNIKSNELKVPKVCINRDNDPALVIIDCLDNARPDTNYFDELSSEIDKAVRSKPVKSVTDFFGVESEEAEIERIRICYEDKNCLLNSVELERLTNFEQTKPSSSPQKPLRAVQRSCGLVALDRYQAACPDYHYHDYYRLSFLVNG